MKTLKEFNPRYVALVEKYRRQNKQAPGALAFMDLCTYAGEHHDEIEKERASWTQEDEKEYSRLLEESFTDADLELLTIIGIHPIQRWHYRKVLEARRRTAADRVNRQPSVEPQICK